MSFNINIFHYSNFHFINIIYHFLLNIKQFHIFDVCSHWCWQIFTILNLHTIDEIVSVMKDESQCDTLYPSGSAGDFSGV